VSLFDLGWSSTLQASFSFDSSLFCPGRVVRAARERLTVQTETTSVEAFSRVTPTDPFPVVGDWVALEQARSLIRHVLPRATCFRRKTAGRRSEAQVIAANVDVAFLVMALVGDYSPRRLERYLTLAHASGAEPIILLTKVALAADVDALVANARAISGATPVHAIDVLAGIGADEPARYLTKGRTAVLLGSSGVGESTLLNHLAGETLGAIGDIRARDARGCHTTTRRELFVLPRGGLLLDTPGMRELGLVADESAPDAAFEEIASLAHTCRFRDCSHGAEPGCAVREAVERGEVMEDRLASWIRLRAEVQKNGARRADQARKAEIKRRTRLGKEAGRHKRGD
jgi:ribosome biogenesis GTPase